MRFRVLLFLFLLVPAAMAPAAPAGLPEMQGPVERWYRVEADGQHAGWSVERVADFREGGRTLRVLESELQIRYLWEVRADVTLHIGPERHSAPQVLTVPIGEESRLRAEYDGDGLRASEFEAVGTGGHTRRVVVRRTVHGYQVTASVDDSSVRRNVSPDDFDATSNVLYERPRLLRRVDDAATLRLLDLGTGRIVERRLRFLAKERLLVLGKKRRLRRIEVSDPTTTYHVWVDRKGLGVMIEFAGSVPAIRAELDEKERAVLFTPPRIEFDEPPDDLPPETTGVQTSEL